MKKILSLLILTGLLTSCGTSADNKNVLKQYLNQDSAGQENITPPQKF